MTVHAGIEVKNAWVTYRNGHPALRDACLNLPAATTAALIGVNGSGKSTLFKAIMGFIPLTAGSVSILGMSPRQAQRRNLVSYVPQSEEVDWNFPVLVEDVVMMGRYGHMGMLRFVRKEDRQAVNSALERVGMLDYRRRQIGELSGGQKKRVFLARSIAQNGQVILLDEPFTGIDMKSEAQVIALLRELQHEGRTLLVSTHHLDSVPDYCNYTILVKGTILACGPTQETFTQENLERAFSGMHRHTPLAYPATGGQTENASLPLRYVANRKI